MTVASRAGASFYDRSFAEFARHSRKTSLARLLPLHIEEPGALVRNADMVLDTLLAQLGSRIHQIHQLPFVIGVTPNVQRIHDIYVSTFQTLQRLPAIKTETQERDMTLRVFPDLLARTHPVRGLLARASLQMRPHMSTEQLNGFMDNMLAGRITRRLLVLQHLHVHHQFYGTTPHLQAGSPLASMHASLPVLDCVRDAYERAKRACEPFYDTLPALAIVGPGPAGGGVRYVRSHLDYMLSELFKNAIRATVEHAEEQQGAASLVQPASALPPIKVSVHVSREGDEVTILVADKGGGVDASVKDSLFDYAVTTFDMSRPGCAAANRNALEAGEIGFGNGFGLPMTRVYARYFGGDVELQTIRGSGTTVLLKLRQSL